MTPPPPTTPSGGPPGGSRRPGRRTSPRFAPDPVARGPGRTSTASTSRGRPALPPPGGLRSVELEDAGPQRLAQGHRAPPPPRPPGPPPARPRGPGRSSERGRRGRSGRTRRTARRPRSRRPPRPRRAHPPGASARRSSHAPAQPPRPSFLGVPQSEAAAAAGSGARSSVSPTRTASTPARPRAATSAARADPALRDHHDVRRDEPDQIQRPVEVGREVGQVPVVDAHDRGAGLQRPLHLAGVVRLHQRRHPQGRGRSREARAARRRRGCAR